MLQSGATETRARTQLLAHSENAVGVGHLLVDHLEAVGRGCGGFCTAFGLVRDGGHAGTLHDLGKADAVFQEYLRGMRQSGPSEGHAALGAAVAYRAGLSSAALAVLSHHTGLQDRPDWSRRLREALTLPVIEGLVELPSPGCASGESFVLDRLADPQVWADGAGLPPGRDLPPRWLLSALVDADRLDTEAHFDPARAGLRTTPPSLTDAAARFRDGRAGADLRPGSDPMDGLRTEVRRRTVENLAAAPVGVYTLTAPTGAGKTLTVVEAAFAHAEYHGLRRVVMAAPFTSVVTQTAQVLRELVGDEVLLEHHSNIADPDENVQGGPGIRARLAAENWDRPLIATTSVQLLETLFSNRTSKLRKLHRLARSVVIIDEVQSIPWVLLEPAVRMLAQVSEAFDVTVVLCTATQPPVGLLPTFKDVPARRPPVELVGDLRGPRPDLERVVTVPLGPTSWDEVADLVADHAGRNDGQAVAVLNTIADTVTLYGLLAGAPGVRYLSTMLCPAHRRRVIDGINSDLEARRPVVLVSTQMIEAGVDVDFPVGFRAVGPLTSIAQTAGRINRHGTRPTSTLFVFDPEDGATPPSDYRIATKITQQLISQGLDPLRLEAVVEFYRLFAATKGLTDELGINSARDALDFAEVAQLFQLITDETVAVTVPYAGFEPMSIALPNAATIRDVRHSLRLASPYVVNLRLSAFNRASAAGLTTSIPGVPLHAWTGVYTNDTGLDLPSAERSLHL